MFFGEFKKVAICRLQPFLVTIYSKILENFGINDYALKTSKNALVGTFTLPFSFINFLPFFCFSKSFLLRVTSP